MEDLPGAADEHSDLLAVRPSRVSVVIVNYRTPELALRCVAALAKNERAFPDLML